MAVANAQPILLVIGGAVICQELDAMTKLCGCFVQ
jgi:hypothetical protein